MKKALLIIRDILILALAVLLILVTVRIIKAQDYRKADPLVQEYLEGDSDVSVEPGLFGTLFDGNGTDSVIVFYGMKGVDEKAYAPMLYALAKGGVDCLIVNMPLKDPSLFRWGAALFMAEYRYKNWYLAGHGEGAKEAGVFASKHVDQFKGLICLGGFPEVNLNTAAFDVWMIYGSQDRIFNRNAYQKNAPYQAVEHVIDGGNFSQFGYFGLYEDGDVSDAAASITPEAQQKEVVDFLLNLMIGQTPSLANN